MSDKQEIYDIYNYIFFSIFRVFMLVAIFDNNLKINSVFVQFVL